MKNEGRLRPSRSQQSAGLKCRVGLFFLSALSMSLAACSNIDTSADVHFSPDGSLVVFGWAKRWDLPLPPETPTIRSVAHVLWCPIDRPEESHSVELGTFGKEQGFWVTSKVHPAFSPDSRYLAVACPGRLWVIDLASRKSWSLTEDDESVTSFVWLADDEVGYVAYDNWRGKKDRVSDRHIYRHKIHDRTDSRVQLFLEEGYEYAPKDGISVGGWSRERWSPDGRYMLFVTKGYKGIPMLMDVQAGTVKPLYSEKPGIDVKAVSWKPDGSAALCILQWRTDPLTVVLVYPSTGEVLDISHDFNRHFGRTRFHTPPQIPATWTPDGKFFLANDSETGGCLVSPRPWAVIPVAKRFVENLERSGIKTRPIWARDGPPWAFQQPAAGWLRIWEYAVDYEGKVLVKVDIPYHAPGGGWTLTPDGKKAVKPETGARKPMLVVRPITLPAVE